MPDQPKRRKPKPRPKAIRSKSPGTAAGGADPPAREVDPAILQQEQVAAAPTPAMPKPKPKPRPKSGPRKQSVATSQRVAKNETAPSGTPVAAVSAESTRPANASPNGGSLPAATVTPVPAPPATSPRAVSQSTEIDDATQPIVPDNTGTASFLWFAAIPSWLTSTVVHVIVLLVLALLTLPPLTRPQIENELVLGDDKDMVESLEEFQDQTIDAVEIEQIDTTDLLVEPEAELIETPLISPAMELAAAPVKVDLDPLGAMSFSSDELGQAIGAMGGDALAGRGSASKARMIREGGGTPGSEAAVASGLKWLASHQLRDGGWSLDHKQGLCQGRCPDIGKKAPARYGATALALLPFLGSGQTHQQGDYQELVDRGLQFLIRNIKYRGKRGLLFDEGNYYSHGISAIVLCEAYAMTHDKALLAPAQAMINETVFAQDPIGGGWRYKARQPGDTSAVGWQLMALKSAHMAYLAVPRSTIDGVHRFLDSVQLHGGANYGYVEPGRNRRAGTSAVGLLCRMYLGWNRKQPGLRAGIAYLDERGPDEEDMYYNYYATQVMRHYGGDEWKTWNAAMRDYLVNTQEQDGHRLGSWVFHTGHANEAGGRLYCTSLCTMILEVYYRHLPLYQKEASEDDFPL